MNVRRFVLRIRRLTILATMLCWFTHVAAGVDLTDSVEPPISEYVTKRPTSNPKLWKWTKDAKHLKSVVKVTVNGSQATGVVVDVQRSETRRRQYDVRILTAYHVVQPSKEDEVIRVTYQNEFGSDAELVEYDETHDIAVIVATSKRKFTPAVVSTTSVRHKMYLEFAGLGGDAELPKTMRHFSGRATQPTNGEFIYADQTLLPGDSGGPIFNKRKELVGIISGGWFWWDAGITSSAGTPVLSTWPARASNVNSLRELIEKSRLANVDETSKPIERLADK